MRISRLLNRKRPLAVGALAILFFFLGLVSRPIKNASTLTEFLMDSSAVVRSPSVQSDQEKYPPHFRDACLQNRVEKEFRAKEISWQELNSFVMPNDVRGSKEKILARFRSRAAPFVHPEYLKAECDDVSCIYSQLYKDKDLAEMAYLFFLVTDSVLSAIPSLGPISPSSPPELRDGNINAFLFKPIEIKRLTLQALYLSARHNRMFANRGLQGMVRFEHGMQIKGDNACGIAYPGSHVLLMDSCLSEQFWHLGFTHEVGHHFDFIGFMRQHTDEETKAAISDIAPANKYISHQEKWLGLSGWSVAETVDKTSGAVRRQWQSKAGLEGFVRSYAATSPEEDFADSLAYYFGSFGAVSKMPIESKRQFISEYILSRGFENRLKSENELLARRAKAIVDLKLDDLVERCAIGGSTNGADAMIANADSCVRRELVKDIEAEIEFSNFEGRGCGSAAANNQLAGTLLNVHSERVSQAVSATLEIEKLKLARKKMSEQLNARRLFLYAAIEENPKAAYDLLLAKVFNENLGLYEGIKSYNSAFELQWHQRANAFEIHQKAFRERLLVLLSPELVERLTGSGWGACTNPQSFSADGIVDPHLTFQHAFLRPSVKPCLTTWVSKIADEIGQRIVPEIAKTFGVTTGKADENVTILSTSFARDLLITRMKALAVSNIESQEKFLNQIDEAQRVFLQDAFKKGNFPALPIAQQLSTCLATMQTAVSKVVEPKLAASFLSSTEKIMKRHQSICRSNLEETAAYRNEIGVQQRSRVRRLFADLNKLDPNAFSFTSRFDKFQTTQLDVPVCLGKVRQLLADKATDFSNWSTEQVSDAFLEICLNGRYAGRFVWTASEKSIVFGFTKVMGTAEYYDAKERAAIMADQLEVGYYVEAQKKFVVWQTEVELLKRRQDQ